jgi:hypothetical protein
VLQKTRGFWWDTRMLVSSANRIGTDFPFTNLGKWFIYIRKSKGPKTEPCGTPCSTLDQAVIQYSACYLEVQVTTVSPSPFHTFPPVVHLTRLFVCCCNYFNLTVKIKNTSISCQKFPRFLFIIRMTWGCHWYNMRLSLKKTSDLLNSAFMYSAFRRFLAL